MNEWFFFFLMIAVVIGLKLHAAFLTRLRVQHPEEWESLGRPTLIRNNSPENSMLTAKYILQAKFRHLDDPQFVRFCERLRLFNIAYLVGFCLLLVAALVRIFHPMLHGT